MKNKNNRAVNRSKKKHAKDVARKNKGVAYGKSVSSFKQIKQLQQPADYNIVVGVDSKYQEAGNESTTFTV